MNELTITSDVLLEDIYLNSEMACKENYPLNNEEQTEMLEREKQVKKMLAELSSHELINKLKESDPLEQGGIIGISGYYFQILVTIYYMIDLLKGKWSFISMEYHDDLIVGNEETKTVRFIQVKSSKEKLKKVSETGIYTRTNSRNISWVDKLFENSRIFNGNEINKQFELFCDYLICDTSGRGKVEVEHYFRNHDETYNWTVDTEDDLYKRLKEDSYDKEGNIINYAQKYGSTLLELLGKLKFTYKTKAFYFTDIVQKGLEELINSRLMDGRVGVTEAHLNWLIGELINRCARGEDKNFLFIRRVEAEQLLYQLQLKCVEDSRKAILSHDNHILLDNGIRSLLEELRGEDATPTFCNEIEIALIEYRKIILATLDKDNSIENMINRFLKGRKIVITRGYDIQPHVNEFIKSSFIVYLYFEMFNISSDFERLLTYSSRNKDVNSWIIFFHAGMRNIKKAIKSLNEIVSETTSLEESLKLIIDKTPIFTILHGSNVGSMPSHFELSTEKFIEHEAFNKENKLTKVTKLSSIIPVNNINEAYVDVDEFNSIEELLKVINTIWDNLITGDKL